MVGCFDPLRPPGLSTASSCGSKGLGEIWSLQSTFEVPYTLVKNYTYQNHIWTETFVTKFFFVRPTLLGGPLVKISKSRKNHYYSP